MVIVAVVQLFAERGLALQKASKSKRQQLYRNYYNVSIWQWYSIIRETIFFSRGILSQKKKKSIAKKGDNSKMFVETMTDMRQWDEK